MEAVLRTALTERFGLRVPIIQAPMAGVSTPELAAAVSNAGGLGSVALGALSSAAAEQALVAARRLTAGPLAANVFVHPTPRRDAVRERRLLEALASLFAAVGQAPPAGLSEIYRSFNDDDEMLDVLIRQRPEALSLHFGRARPDRLAALREAGIVLLGTATSLPEARLLADDVDLIVLQGRGAGGHFGAFLDPDLDADMAAGAEPGAEGAETAEALAERMLDELEALVVAVAAELPTPVIAAGGLMNGADVGRMLAAGAAGAQLGTAFVSCPESLASETYVQSLTSARTALTDRVSGRPARGLENPLLSAVSRLPGPVPDYPLTYDAVKQLVAATGDPAFSVMWAGVGSRRARVLPAASLVERLSAELAALGGD